MAWDSYQQLEAVSSSIPGPSPGVPEPACRNRSVSWLISVANRSEATFCRREKAGSSYLWSMLHRLK